LTNVEEKALREKVNELGSTCVKHNGLKLSYRYITSRLYGSTGLYKAIGQSNTGAQILTPHISVTAEPILTKLEIKNYHLKATYRAKPYKVSSSKRAHNVCLESNDLHSVQGSRHGS